MPIRSNVRGVFTSGCFAHRRDVRSLRGVADARRNAGHVESALRELLRTIGVLDDAVGHTHHIDGEVRVLLAVHLEQRRYGSAKAVHNRAFFDGDDGIVSGRHPGEHRHIERLNEAAVHDRRIDAFGSQLVGGLECRQHHRAHSEDGDAVSEPQHFTAAVLDGRDLVERRHGGRHVIARIAQRERTAVVFHSQPQQRQHLGAVLGRRDCHVGHGQ